MDYAELLRSAANEMRRDDHSGWPNLCDASADEIERLRVELGRYRWVPVGERLPGSREAVLIWSPTNLCHYMAQWVDGKWVPWAHSHISTSNEITHWMPLPPPPENSDD